MDSTPTREPDWLLELRKGCMMYVVIHYRETCAGVAEWQTRWIQNPVTLWSCGFNSHLRYSLIQKDLRRFYRKSFSYAPMEL